MTDSAPPQPPPPRRRKRTPAPSKRLQRRSVVLTLVATLLAIIAAGVAIFTAAAVADPTLVANLVGSTPEPTTTLFIYNPTATVDPRGTFPPTFTPSMTLRPPVTVTASATTTITPTATVTTTRIPTLTFTPINTVPVGWIEFQSKEARMAMQFTATWTAVTLVGRDASETLTQITAEDPVLSASIRDGLGIAVLDDLVLLAFDTATSSDAYTVNMTVAYASSGTTVDEVYQTHLDIYQNNDFYSVISVDETRVDGRYAQRIRYTSRFVGSDGLETLIYHQEVIAEQRRESDPILIITLSTSELRRNIYEALLDRIVTTIRYLR